jgi:hypothetical protein
MSPKDGFGIVVRAVGLGLMIHGARPLLSISMTGWYSSAGFWLHVILAIGLGLWMLRGARPLVDWAYAD